MTAFTDRSFAAWRRFRRSPLLALPVGLALTMLLPAFSGCACPEPKYPTPVVDSPENVRNVATTIANAQARRVWTVNDERAFSHNLSHLSPDTAFAYAMQIAKLINTQMMAIDRSESKTPRPPRCPCATCNGTTLPAPPAPPVTTGGRQPGTAPGTTGAASPAAKQPLQAPTRVP